MHRLVLIVIVLLLVNLLNITSAIVIGSSDSESGNRGELLPLIEGLAEKIEFRELRHILSFYSPKEEIIRLKGFEETPSRAFLILGIAMSNENMSITSLSINGRTITFRVKKINVLEHCMPYFSVLWCSVPSSLVSNETITMSIRVRGENERWGKCAIEGGLLLGIYDGRENCYYKLYIGPYAVYRHNSTLSIALSERVLNRPVNMTMSTSGDEDADIIIKGVELKKEKSSWFSLIRGHFNYSGKFDISISSFSISAFKICYLLFYTSPTVFYEKVLFKIENTPTEYLKLLSIRVDDNVFKVSEPTTIIRLPKGTNIIKLYIGKYKFKTLEVEAPGSYLITLPFHRNTIHAKTSYGRPVHITVKIGGVRVSEGVGACTAYFIEGFTEIELRYEGQNVIYKYERSIKTYVFPTGIAYLRERDALYRIIFEAKIELPEGVHSLRGRRVITGWIRYPSVKFKITRAKETLVEFYPCSMLCPSIGLQALFYILFTLILALWSFKSIKGCPYGYSKKLILGKVGSVLLRLHWLLLPVYFLLYTNPVIAYILPIGMVLIGISTLMYSISRPLNIILSSILLALGATIMLQFVGVVNLPYPLLIDEVYSGYSKSPAGLLSLSLVLSIFLTIVFSVLDMLKERRLTVISILLLSTIALISYVYIYDSPRTDPYEQRLFSLIRLFIPIEIFYIISYIILGVVVLSLRGSLIDIMDVTGWYIPETPISTEREEILPIMLEREELVHHPSIPAEIMGFIKKADEDFEKWKSERESNMAHIYLRNAFENLFNATIVAVKLYLGRETTRWGELKKLLESRNPELAKEFRRFIGVHVKIYRRGNIPPNPENYYLRYKRRVMNFIDSVLSGK